MACTGFEKCLAVAKEALSRTANARDIVEATHHELETYLEESKVKLATTKKIQAKVEASLRPTNEEVNHLDAHLMEASWLDRSEGVD